MKHFWLTGFFLLLILSFFTAVPARAASPASHTVSVSAVVPGYALTIGENIRELFGEFPIEAIVAASVMPGSAGSWNHTVYAVNSCRMTRPYALSS